MDSVVKFIDETVDAMLDRPRVWGSHRSVEGQVMRLLEVRAVALSSSESFDVAGEVERHFVRFLRDELPGSPETTLFTRIKEDAGKFQTLLRKFVEMIRRTQAHSVDKPTAGHARVLATAAG